MATHWTLGGDAKDQLIRSKVAELLAAGATIVREDSYGEQLDHVAMLDPEGNDFASRRRVDGIYEPACRRGRANR